MYFVITLYKHFSLILFYKFITGRIGKPQVRYKESFNINFAIRE